MISHVVETELAHEALSQDYGPIQMNFGDDAVEIRDLRNHSAGTVMRLALLLVGTVDVRPDPKRKNFYEVSDGSEVYYIHVSPVTGIIYLLAVWQSAVAQRNAVRVSGTRITPLARKNVHGFEPTILGSTVLARQIL